MSCSFPYLELKIYHLVLRASRPFLLPKACLLSPETNLRIVLTDFAWWQPPQQRLTEVRTEGSKGQNEEQHLQVHQGAVHGAEPRFLTTANHQSFSQSALGNGGHHSWNSQIPSSHQFSGLSIGLLPRASFSPLDQTSKISLFWLTFHSGSAVQDG